jgi:hypothetical protein
MSGSQGFRTTFSVLLALSAIYCAMAALIRREPFFGWALTHWDEAAAYATLGLLLRFTVTA